MNRPPHDVPDSAPGSPPDVEVTRSLGRIAERMSTERPDLAHSALRTATSIRRRRTGMGLAASAAVIAITVPVTWQLAQQAARTAPAQSSSGTTQSGTKPDTATGAPTGEQRPDAADRPVLVALDTSRPPTGRLMQPYALGGIYHGTSGSSTLAATQGLRDVLDLADGAKVLTVQSGTSRNTIVQDAKGRVTAVLDGVDGRAVASSSLDRAALVDTDTGRALLLDQRGAVVASLDGGHERALGFVDGRVVLTTERSTQLWDPATGLTEDFDDSPAVDVADDLGLALFAERQDGINACWTVRSVRDRDAPAVAHGCGGYLAERLSADGRFVIGRDLPVRTDAAIVIASTWSRKSVMSIWLPHEASIQGMEWRADLEHLVANVVTSSGDARLMGCGLASRSCDVLTKTVANPGWPQEETPYVLVRD